MRYSGMAFVAASLFGVALLSAKPKPPMSAVVSPSSQTVKSGTSVLLKVTLTNTSEHNLVFSDGNPICDYPMTVRDSDGNEPPESASKQKSDCDEKYLIIARNIRIELKPRETRSGQINTSDYYDLRRTGTYTIQLFRHLPAKISEQDIPANSATVIVTE
jgi:hypothetical protein